MCDIADCRLLAAAAGSVPANSFFFASLGVPTVSLHDALGEAAAAAVACSPPIFAFTIDDPLEFLNWFGVFFGGAFVLA